MSNRTNNAPTPGNWRYGQSYGSHAPNSNDWNLTVFPRSLSYGATRNASGGAQEPWWTHEERVITGPPFGLASFPAPSHSPIRLLVLDNDLPREMNPRLGQFLQESHPRFAGQRTTQVPAQDEESRLTKDQQYAALKNMKTEIYNPMPKSLAKRHSFYYRDRARNSFNDKGKEQDDDGKACAVCLEDLESQQMVMTTPCGHMFHEDCIVPWIKSHGQCPVCRFALCEQVRQSAAPRVNNNVMPRSDSISGDLISIIRAMEDAFEWRNMTR
ncbi:uncharacterized protein LOC132311219 [Cornus florida]|uniref:uncharacterized protein LOC132311219 n=1 Tax=Cornus florida TaxID=4283 RepID=UPI0028A0A113|nr:uncharacterized protein LOC132311219 [Cornus florida]